MELKDIILETISTLELNDNPKQEIEQESAVSAQTQENLDAKEILQNLKNASAFSNSKEHKRIDFSQNFSESSLVDSEKLHNCESKNEQDKISESKMPKIEPKEQETQKESSDFKEQKESKPSFKKIELSDFSTPFLNAFKSFEIQNFTLDSQNSQSKITPNFENLADFNSLFQNLNAPNFSNPFAPDSEKFKAEFKNASFKSAKNENANSFKNEEQFLQMLLDRLGVFFEGLSSQNMSEKKLDITLNFLHYQIDVIKKRLEILSQNKNQNPNKESENE